MWPYAAFQIATHQVLVHPTFEDNALWYSDWFNPCQAQNTLMSNLVSYNCVYNSFAPFITPKLSTVKVVQ